MLNIYVRLPYKGSSRVEMELVECHGGFRYSMTFDVYTQASQLCEISIAAMPRKKSFLEYCEGRSPFTNKETAKRSLIFFQECLNFLEEEFSGWMGHCNPSDPRRLRIYSAYLSKRGKEGIKVNEYGTLTWEL